VGSQAAPGLAGCSGPALRLPAGEIGSAFPFALRRFCASDVSGFVISYAFRRLWMDYQIGDCDVLGPTPLRLLRNNMRLRTSHPTPPTLSLIFMFFFVSALVPLSASALCPDFGLPAGSEIVEFETNRGAICLELLRDEAPITVWNFVNYVVRGDYDGTIIHRSVSNFVIQGGAFESTSNSLSRIPIDAQIQNEPCTIQAGNTTCTDRSSIRGSVAMARVGGQVNSATSQYFINLADNSFLDSVDQGFTVFANVLGGGLVVADDINALPNGTPNESWWIAPPVGGVLAELPLQNAVPFFPTPFGCWDPGDLAVVVSPLNHLGALPDPFFGTTLYPLSGGCGTKIPRFSFVEDPGPPSCPDLDLLTTGITGPINPQIINDPATNNFLQYEFSCLQTAEALIRRDLWRDDLGVRAIPELVSIGSATYQTVPEPSLSIMLASGLAIGIMLARRKRDLT
jgi:cyclophilin family peptidyl-prolyl cis-trans isomerase